MTPPTGQRETAMPPSPKSAPQAASGAKRARRQPLLPSARLNASMACDTAFRIVAGRYLGDLTASQEATCTGDPSALHHMRIALTRLRTAILLFSPMIDDPQRARLRAELKWLNSQLGTVRDLDVAMQRLGAANRRRPQATAWYRTWNEKRADSHRELARALRSARYRRLIESLSGWIDNGPWSIRKGKQAAEQRARAVAGYGADKLIGWRGKLLKKCRKLGEMDTRKRHRLRLLNKKLSYSIEFFEDLFADKKFAGHQAALKYLRKAQKSLGQLNDDAKGHSLATELQQDGVDAALEFLSAKREARLLKSATSAYRKLAALKP
jgi:CHAD domain-containing protein